MDNFLTITSGNAKALPRIVRESTACRLRVYSVQAESLQRSGVLAVFQHNRGPTWGDPQYDILSNRPPRGGFDLDFD